MTSTLRIFLLISSFSVGVSALAACSGKDETPEDILAQDSSLAREVMSANHDTAMAAAGDTPTPAVDSITPGTAPLASTGTVFEGKAAEPAPEPEPSVQPAARIASSKPATRRRAARSSSVRRSSRVYSSASRAETRAAVRRNARRSAATSRMSDGEPATPSISRTASPTTRLGGSAMIPVGSELTFASDDRICTSTGNVVGRFSTRLAEDIVGPIGVVIPKGSIATGLVAAGGTASSENPERSIHIQSLTFGGRTYNLSSEVTDAELDKIRTRSKSAPVKLIAGAGIGAILGQVIGGDVTSTVIGAAGGAAAGAVVANRTTGFDRCVPSGGLITARLTEPLRVALGE